MNSVFSSTVCDVDGKIRLPRAQYAMQISWANLVKITDLNLIFNKMAALLFSLWYVAMMRPKGEKTRVHFRNTVSKY